MKPEDIINYVVQIITFSFIFIAVSVLATSIYGAFYWSFVPKPIYEGPVHFVFEPCNEEMAKCGFLNGTIELSTDQNPPVLLDDQAYTLSLQLEMPESKVNQELGMFMTCAQVRSQDKLVLKKNCKSTIMKYKSGLIRSLELMFMWPAILTDYAGEQQMVRIQFLDDFQDDPMRPAMSIDFQVMSRFAEIYEAKYQVQAKFTGLRYILYFFPMTSAVFGIGFNFMWLMIILFFTWYGFLAKPVGKGTNPDSGLSGEVSDLELLDHPVQQEEAAQVD